MNGPDDGPLATRPKSLALARRYARGMTLLCPHLRDDAQAEAYLALVQAESTFEPALGASWRSHAARRVWGAVKNLLREEFRGGLSGLGKATPINLVKEYHDDEHEPCVADDGPRLIDDADEAEYLLGLLPDNERFVATQAYLGGRPLKRAGAAMGLSPSWSFCLATRATDRLRDRLAGGVHDPNA